MRSGNRIAIVGAGIAGLVCAKVLTEDGFAVEVFDRAPDIGGVWSETRRYPGLRAQSTKNTYHFSDHPMPADYPRVLDGARMQEYLSSYVRAFGLTDKLRLRTEVVAADPVDGGWLLEIRDADGVHRTSCDHLVIANGVFSEPEVPDFAGATAFARAGGQLGHSTQFLDVEAVRDRSVVVVGYGAAAGDLATEISRVAADTTVVARRLLWKMPRRLAAGLDAERILLTRTGAAHFRHPDPGRFERLLHGPARSFRESNLDLIEALVAERSRAAELGLLPGVRFEQAYDAAFGLATTEFAEQVAQGRIAVRGQTRVVALGGGPAGPFAELSDGQRIRADIVVCATGFQQRVPFLTPYVQRQLTDDSGNFRLYRQILPLDVPHLTFAGYNTSLLSAVGAEAAAHWTAALLTGSLALPAIETMTERIDSRLQWLDEHTGGRHAHGTVTPYALRDIDELLADIGVRLPLAARAAQWVRPVRPGDYRVLSRRKRRAGGQPETPPVPAPPAAQAPPTAPLAVAPPAAAGGARAASAGPAPVSSAASAESPTVRIPEAVLANATRTTALPAVDPAARTRPVPEVRPAAAPAPPRSAPAASSPAPIPRPAPSPAPAPPRSVPSPAPAPPRSAPVPGPGTPRSAAAQEAAAEATRRAAAEQRAAGIAARSNNPTVRIDMRTAQSLADGVPQGSPESRPAGPAGPGPAAAAQLPQTGVPVESPSSHGDPAGQGPGRPGSGPTSEEKPSTFDADSPSAAVGSIPSPAASAPESAAPTAESATAEPDAPEVGESVGRPAPAERSSTEPVADAVAPGLPAEATEPAVDAAPGPSIGPSVGQADEPGRTVAEGAGPVTTGNTQQENGTAQAAASVAVEAGADDRATGPGAESVGPAADMSTAAADTSGGDVQPVSEAGAGSSGGAARTSASSAEIARPTGPATGSPKDVVDPVAAEGTESPAEGVDPVAAGETESPAAAVTPAGGGSSAEHETGPTVDAVASGPAEPESAAHAAASAAEPGNPEDSTQPETEAAAGQPPAGTARRT
ncbi:FAD-dependent oxidoreductase [Nocardia sp. NPDC051750]|uniref:FAD-dependent oxidoreductase n=1 Tax=Nocardia sp. NPDC051750 TaxID=3364325 RepID=UPI0037B229DB